MFWFIITGIVAGIFGGVLGYLTTVIDDRRRAARLRKIYEQDREDIETSCKKKWTRITERDLCNYLDDRIARR